MDDTLTLEDFRDMEVLEKRFYSADLVTPALESWRWYLLKPFSIVAARGEDGHIAGFVNLFPIPEHIHRDLVAGTFNDANLEAEDIVDPWADDAEAPLHMFLSCIVVDESHRGRTLSRQLLRRACEQFADVAGRVQDIAIDTATADGERLAHRMGFQPVCETDHATRVWSRDYLGFARTCGVS